MQPEKLQQPQGETEQIRQPLRVQARQTSMPQGTTMRRQSKSAHSPGFSMNPASPEAVLPQ
jgi:hypothetical protein